MNNNRLNIQMLSMIAIVVAAFTGSAVLFAYLNTDAIKQSVASETRLSSSVMASAIEDEIDKALQEASQDGEALKEEPSQMTGEGEEQSGSGKRTDNAEAADARTTGDGEDQNESGTSAQALAEAVLWNEDASLPGILDVLISCINLETGESVDVWVVDKHCSIYYENTTEDAKGLEELLSTDEWHDIRRASLLDTDAADQYALLWLGKQSYLMLSQELLVVRPVLEEEFYLVMLNKEHFVHAMQRRYFILFIWIEAVLMAVMVVVLVNTLFNYRKQLIRLATKDELTGLSNRKSFNEAYREYIKNTLQDTQDTFTVLLIDIDFFKQINDNYGHAAGDLALKTLAGYIGRMAKRYDGFAGRWGGDEFISVLSIAGEEAHAAVKELCHLVRNARMEGDVRITISVGAVEAKRSSSPELAHLTELADQALYVSKANGRNRYNFYSKKDKNENTQSNAASDVKDNNENTQSNAAADVLNVTEEAGSRGAEAADASDETGTAPSAPCDRAEAGHTSLTHVSGTASVNLKPQGGVALTNRTSLVPGQSGPEPFREREGNVSRREEDKAVKRSGSHGGVGAFPQGDDASTLEAGRETSFEERMKEFLEKKLIYSILLGVKWMAPFVAGGGLMIGLAFLFDASSVDLGSLSVLERTQLGTITPIAASLKNIGDSTFNFMLPIFAGFMAYGLAGESAFLSGFVGGFMTIQSNAGFIGAMIAGLVAGFIASEIKAFIGRMPRFIQKAAPIVIFPVFNLLFMYGITSLAITPVSSALGKAFTHLLDALNALNSTLAGGAAGAMMAIDMGGIINKVAYTYGVKGLSSGGTVIMASVMAGGMVPPVGIALSMFMYKKKYTAAERDRTASTLFMGLSFITEGALPFVFSDVLRVIPACVVGSAVAGMLSALFGCQLPAPHGGIFVLPVMTHPLRYLVALAAGSVATACLLGRMRKEAEETEDDRYPD